MTALRPLLLTGGPAVGKTTTARALADTTERCAHIDVDDVRQMIRNGGVAPWKGEEGRAQHVLGIRNAAALVHNFAHAGINVIVSDVVTQDLLNIYRDLVPDLVAIRLVCDLSTARARASSRPVHLTADEFEMLHRQQTEPLETDLELDVSGMTLEAQVDAVGRRWRRQSHDLKLRRLESRAAAASRSVGTGRRSRGCRYPRQVEEPIRFSGATLSRRPGSG